MWGIAFEWKGMSMCAWVSGSVCVCVFAITPPPFPPHEGGMSSKEWRPSLTFGGGEIGKALVLMASGKPTGPDSGQMPLRSPSERTA